MASTVAGQEDYLTTFQFTGHEDVGGIAKWGGYLKLLRIAQTGHCVKPAPAYDSYFRLMQTGSEGWDQCRFKYTCPNEGVGLPGHPQVMGL